MSSSSDSESDPDATSSFEGARRYARGTFYHARIGECVQSWRIQSKLGFGRFSTVWSCVDRNEPAACEPTHALKLSRSDDSGWRDEVETLGKIGAHPCVVRMLSSFEVRGAKRVYGCVVTSMHGQSLAQLVRRGVALEHETLLGIARVAAAGIAHVHAAGFVHTDIKPDNVLLRQALSRAIVGAPRELRVFARERKGKPRRAAPEAKASATTELKAPALEEAAFGPGSFCVVGDLGNAERIGHYPPEPGSIQPRLYRAPEVVAYLPHTEAVDVYAAGAVVHFAATAGALFDPEGDTSESRNAEHVRLIARTLGPFPDYMRRASHVVRVADSIEFDPLALADSAACWLVRALTAVDPYERPSAAVAALAQSPAMVE